jgi:hypothetical protein
LSQGDAQDEDMNSRVASSATPDYATMMMVRMVNRIPLLDGAEASSCGLVQAVLHKKKMWNSFGLEVSSNGFHHRRQDKSVADSDAVLQTFQVRDSDQVAPFFKSTNHTLMEEDPFQEEDVSENSDSENEDFPARRKRKRNKARKWLLPARVRLGNVLVIVQIDAEPTSLPLPTLSKVLEHVSRHTSFLLQICHGDPAT